MNDPSNESEENLIYAPEVENIITTEYAVEGTASPFEDYSLLSLHIYLKDSLETHKSTLFEKIVTHPMFSSASGVLLVALLVEYMLSHIK